MSDAGSAWGRWGDDDQRGALNLLGPEAVLRAVGAVRDNRSISLAAPLSRTSPTAPHRTPMAHFMSRTGGDYLAGHRAEVQGMGFSDDYVVLGAHGTTHLDALCHVWSDGRMYNGFDSSLVTSGGASALGIENVGAIVTRGILLDAAVNGGQAEAIGPERLDELLGRTGAVPQPGDALLIRTGWPTVHETAPAAADGLGLTRSCGAWVAAHDLVLVGADNVGIEVTGRRDDGVQPLHVTLLRDHGIYMLELLSLDELAASGRAEFMLVVNPLPIHGGTGGPCAPVAVI